MENKTNNRYWHEEAGDICCINSYPNGITFSSHANTNTSVHFKSSNNAAANLENNTYNRYALRLRDTRSYQLPVGKYFLYKTDVKANLERHLWDLRKKGKLENSVVYFGTIADPFSAFHKRFDNTMACLELLERYQPARVVIQTRSPMLISALPILKKMGDKAIANMFIESNKESSIARYTPGMPTISQRLLAIQGVRAQGVNLAVSVGPVLPYGGFERDAWDFAELIDRYSDYVTLGSLAGNTESSQKSIKNMELARKLELDKEFKMLRPESHKPLLKALLKICPEKLDIPLVQKLSQIEMFAA